MSTAYIHHAEEEAARHDERMNQAELDELVRFLKMRWREVLTYDAEVWIRSWQSNGWSADDIKNYITRPFQSSQLPPSDQAVSSGPPPGVTPPSYPPPPLPAVSASAESASAESAWVPFLPN